MKVKFVICSEDGTWREALGEVTGVHLLVDSLIPDVSRRAFRGDFDLDITRYDVHVFAIGEADAEDLERLVKPDVPELNNYYIVLAERWDADFSVPLDPIEWHDGIVEGRARTLAQQYANTMHKDVVLVNNGTGEEVDRFTHV